MSRDQKKLAKKKKRELKNLEQKRHVERVDRERRRRDRYPQVLIDPTNGDLEFVELVRKANTEIDFDDPTQFASGDRAFYVLLRQYGFRNALQVLREGMRTRLEQGDELAQVGENRSATAVWDGIIRPDS